MKKSIPLGVLLAGMLFAFLPFITNAQSSEESVTRFDSLLNVQADSSVKVTERIVYTFGDNQKHGIYRDIPVSYKTSLGKLSVKLVDIKVTDENGKAYTFETSRSGTNEQIKIGDADVLVSGTKTYIVSYTIERVIGYFADYDELYWNVTGNEWQVPIMEASAEVVLPQAIDAQNVRQGCYEGEYGSNNSCAIAATSTESMQHFYFAASSPLAAAEGLTVAVGFPKGIVYQPTKWERILQISTDNWIVVVPFIVLATMIYLWRKYGKDEKGTGVVIAEYEAPDSLTPLELSALQNSSVKNSALSAEIIYLAIKGYLSIKRIDVKGFLKADDYELTKLKDGKDLPKTDKLLMEGLFATNTVKLSELKEKFYKKIPDIKKSVMETMLSRKYYLHNPQTTRGVYFAAGIAVGFLFTILGAATGNGGTLNVISGIISGAIIVLFAYAMPKLTKVGALSKEKAEGLKLYMNVAEKDRINFHNAPEKNPQLFEKLLPFAMVLGVEAAWTKQFEGIYTQPPSWYGDSTGHAFNSLYFANSLNTFSDSARSTLVSAPNGGSGSGGGGFSGGGMGGGGGGSW